LGHLRVVRVLDVGVVAGMPNAPWTARPGWDVIAGSPLGPRSPRLMQVPSGPLTLRIPGHEGRASVGAIPAPPPPPPAMRLQASLRVWVGSRSHRPCTAMSARSVIGPEVPIGLDGPKTSKVLGPDRVRGLTENFETVAEDFWIRASWEINRISASRPPL